MFGAEFVDMKFGEETLHAIQYKLRMMSIPIGPLTFIEETYQLSIIPQCQSQQ